MILEDVYKGVKQMGVEGVVASEIEALGICSKKQAQSSLSKLHKAGFVSRLKLKKAFQSVYVTPANVLGRETEPFGDGTVRKRRIKNPYSSGAAKTVKPVGLNLRDLVGELLALAEQFDYVSSDEIRRILKVAK